MHTCIKCGLTKEDHQFKKHWEKGKVTLRNVCKACYNNQVRGRAYSEVLPKTTNTDSPNDCVDVITKFLDACNYDYNEVDNVPEDKFFRCYHIESTDLSFDEIKKQARLKLEDLGYLNNSNKCFNECGNYLIIGDTFGKRTNSEKFALLKKIAKVREVKNIIVIGHNTDDYADVSNAFMAFDQPVYFIPIKNELKDINKFSKNSDKLFVVLDEIRVGDILIKNQDYITPYSKSGLSKIDSLLYPGKCIVNCTRHELYTRTSTDTDQYICSPGAMSEPHVERIQYKLTLSNGGRLNVVSCSKDSFLKYRKNDIDKSLWEMGCIVVGLKDDFKTELEMIRIKEEADNHYCCVLKDGKYLKDNENTVTQLNPAYAVLSDIHTPNENKEAINETLVILKKLKPKKILINGDLLDCRSYNPHSKLEAMKWDFEEELSACETLLSRFNSELNVPIELFSGNHEDFIARWLKEVPQLHSFVLKAIKDRLSKYCSVSYNTNNSIVHLEHDLNLVHGSNKIWGQSGTQLEQLTRTVGTCIMGHTHSPQIRFGTYCSGCLCSGEQGYNNQYTNNWTAGFLLVYKTPTGHTVTHQILLTDI